MTRFELTHYTEVFGIGFLSVRIKTILNRIERKRPLVDKDYMVLKEEVKLISFILEGSLFVETKLGFVIPSIRSWFVFGQALLVLKKMKVKVEKDGDLTKIFSNYHNNLLNLSQRKLIENREFVNLKNFFNEFSDLMRSHLMNGEYGRV